MEFFLPNSFDTARRRSHLNFERFHGFAGPVGHGAAQKRVGVGPDGRRVIGIERVVGCVRRDRGAAVEPLAAVHVLGRVQRIRASVRRQVCRTAVHVPLGRDQGRWRVLGGRPERDRRHFAQPLFRPGQRRRRRRRRRGGRRGRRDRLVVVVHVPQA